MSQASYYKVIIIGSGAAGLNCAIQLTRNGILSSEIAIITERIGGGTSFNSGSDKQTYYRLNPIGDVQDSPFAMAHSFFDGGAMHGDIALIEATCSNQAFMHLVGLGVPFPHDEFGAFIGYKTDNDPLQRGTSAGPLTSRMMGEALLKEVQRQKIPILEHRLVIKLLKTDANEICGLIAVNEEQKNIDLIFETYRSDFVVLATGGPAAVYADSVYPEDHWGSTGLAIDAGVTVQNMTEWQYGLASKKFRWNVSGTYMQVIPRIVSLPLSKDPKSNYADATEFLQEYFPNVQTMVDAIFLKGYQWPFNPERIVNYGSSLIDLAIHYEVNNRNRQVFLDFQANPEGFDVNNYVGLGKIYLHNSNALQERPIERLAAMNFPAIQLYKDHQIDLNKELLEIGICAQHCNGGLKGDAWWQTNITRLFAIGEVNGTHGIHRPGGSALNSGQVGGIRAAERIAYWKWLPVISGQTFNQIAQKEYTHIFRTMTAEPKLTNARTLLQPIQLQMSRIGAHVRDIEDLKKLDIEIRTIVERYWNIIHVDTRNIGEVWRIWDTILTQMAIVQSELAEIQKHGGSRGSHLILPQSRNEDTVKPHPKLEFYAFRPPNNELKTKICEFTKDIQGPKIEWTNCRPIPIPSGWFETIWKKFQDRDIFYS